jgi:hypothetical protein
MWHCIFHYPTIPYPAHLGTDLIPLCMKKNNSYAMIIISISISTEDV